MEKEQFELFQKFIEDSLNRPLESCLPRRLSGKQVLDALWPLNDVLRRNLMQIRSLRYDATFEAAADSAIRSAAMSPWPPRWDDLPAGAWRVILERHTQALMVATANELTGNAVMTIPAELNAEQVTTAAMIYMLFQMKLPWPAGDRSAHELPVGSAQASLRRH